MTDKKSSPTNVREQAIQIKEAWSNIGQNVTYGDIALMALVAKLDEFEKADSTLKSLEDQITLARNTFTETRYELWDLIKRVKNGAKAKHGDDSTEYERFGGKKISDRNTRSKKATNKKST